MDANEIVEKADIIPCWCSKEERAAVAAEAMKVKGQIVEIGGLYGGMTCVIALASPESKITVIDDFSWSPIEGRQASRTMLLSATEHFGITNVHVVEGDSRIVGKRWQSHIDLLWIDGGHSYEYVFSDLRQFGPYATKILLHDYKNPFWPQIEEAITAFIALFPEAGWEIEYNVGMVVSIHRSKPE